MNLNPICHPSPARKMKCLFLDYFQFLVIMQAGRWTQMPSTTPLQAKNEMLIFGLHSTSDDQLGWSMDSNPICHPVSSQRMKCSFLDYIQLLMIGQAGQWTQTPSATSLQPKIWNVCFWIMLNFWWSARLVEGLEPHLQPLSSQKNEMLIFGLCSTSGNQPGWSMDSSPSVTPLQPRKWNAVFGMMFNFWWSAGLVNGLKPHLPPLFSQKNEMLIFGLQAQLLMIGQAGQRTPTPSATSFQPKKWNAHFCIMFKFWWSAKLVDRLEPHLPPLSSQKNEMLIFGLRYTSDDQPGWSMDSKPMYHPWSQKMKC